MTPTSDQIGRAIVAAVRECGVFEYFEERPERLFESLKSGYSVMTDNLRHAKAYAAFAIRKAFPMFPSAAIGRALGAGKPEAFLGILLAYRAKGKLPWYDPEVEARIVAAIGEDMSFASATSKDGQAICEGMTESGESQAASGRSESLHSSNAEPTCNRGRFADTGSLRPPSSEIRDSVAAGETALSSSRVQVQERSYTVRNYDRPASKLRLEEELRQAVLNTGGRLK